MSDDVPFGASALALAASATAEALAQAARAAGDAGLAAQAEALRSRVAAAANLNAEAYRRALAVRGAVVDLSDERRDWEIGRAYAAAGTTPLELARLGAEIVELAVAIGGPDAAAAAAVAAAVARGAVPLVETNLTASADDERVLEARRLAERAREQVESLMRG